MGSRRPGPLLAAPALRPREPRRFPRSARPEESGRSRRRSRLNRKALPPREAAGGRAESDANHRRSLSRGASRANRFRAGFLTQGRLRVSPSRSCDRCFRDPGSPLQWRDRGGISPHFPFNPPRVGTRKMSRPRCARGTTESSDMSGTRIHPLSARPPCRVRGEAPALPGGGREGPAVKPPKSRYPRPPIDLQGESPPSPRTARGFRMPRQHWPVSFID